MSMDRLRDRTLFLSLLPEFADLILDGTKRIELRRVRPRALPGTHVVVYATSPRRAILGGCEVVDVCSGDPDEIWELHGTLAAIDRDRFDRYFVGAAQAVAIRLGNPWRLSEPLRLSVLRENWEGFNPPQSFRYVTPRDLGFLTWPVQPLGDGVIRRRA